MTIQELATIHDATIITDRVGDIALLRRHYDDDGVRQLRHVPDPCDHLPESEWEAMTPEQAATRSC